MSKATRWLVMALVLLLALGALAACGDDREDTGDAADAPAAEAPAEEEAVAAGDPAAGEEIFNTTCLACHGQGGIGVQGLGKDMTTSEFIHGQSDADLLTFIKQGRDTSHPDNTTGVAMPPRGGNPALTDEQLLDVIAYIRTLDATAQ